MLVKCEICGKGYNKCENIVLETCVDETGHILTQGDN